MADVKVDGRFRTMSIPASQKVLGCVGDVAAFDCPRYVDDNDMDGWRFRVHYRTPNGDADRYEVVDAVTDEKRIRFTWKPRPVAFEAAGKVTAAVEAAKLDGLGAVTREFNTAPGSFTVEQTIDSEPHGDRVVDDEGAYIVFGTEGE